MRGILTSMTEYERIREFIERKRGRTTFLEHEVKEVFRDMGFAVPKGFFLGTGEVVPYSVELAYPVVAKVSSSKIISKSDVGGIRTGITDREALERALQELSRIQDAEGVLVEEMAPQGLEVVIGGTVDSQFGPVVMFGLGGIFVELFKDIAFALAPLSTKEAQWLIRQVKGYRLMEAYRGKPPVDREQLLRLLISVSEIMASGMVREIDLNPVALYAEGAVILDAKIEVIS